MRKHFAILALFLAFGGCQTVAHNTPSGRPEVKIAAAAERVRPEMINGFIDRGYTVVEDTPYRLVVDRSSTSVMANLLLGSSWNPRVNARISLTIAGIGNETRVVADMNIVTNPGTSFERLTPASNSKDSEEIQLFLTFLKNRVEHPGAPANTFAPAA